MKPARLDNAEIQALSSRHQTMSDRTPRVAREEWGGGLSIAETGSKKQGTESKEQRTAAVRTRESRTTALLPEPRPPFPVLH
jgi:hypothetical protein